MSLQNYDPNIYEGVHEIKVMFQQWKYKGFVTYEIGGNVKGMEIFPSDSDDLYDCKFKENPIGFKDLDEDWFFMTLKDDEGNELKVEEEFDYLSRYIVGFEIVGFKEEKE